VTTRLSPKASPLDLTASLDEVAIYILTKSSSRLCQTTKWTRALHTMVRLSQAIPTPVFDCLQYASMEGKAWEIWLHAIMSGRQRVDPEGVVPDGES